MKRKIIVKAFVQDAVVHHKLSAMNFASEFVDTQFNLSSLPMVDIAAMEGYADILMLELDGAGGDATDALQPLLQNLDGQMLVIVLMRNSNAKMVRQLMRQGVHDVILLPADWDEMENDLRGIIKSRQQLLQAKSARVISFLSAKGGAGATTVAVNVAYEMASRHHARVCLVDLDLQFGDVASCLDSDGRKNIMEALRQPERIDPLFLKALISNVSPNFDILPSPADLCDIASVSEKTIARIIDAISESYDFVLIDLPHNLLPWNIEALRKSDRSFLVVQRSIGFVRNARILLDNLPRYGVDSSQIELINNRDSRKTGLMNHKTLAEMLDRPYFFNIRNNYRMVLDANEAGKPIDRISVGSGVSRDIEHIAAAVAKNQTAQKSNRLLAHVFHQ
ncbi:MAG TPA: AAA family ATPase [Pseudomonadales bacterium]